MAPLTSFPTKLRRFSTKSNLSTQQTSVAMRTPLTPDPHGARARVSFLVPEMVDTIGNIYVLLTEKVYECGFLRPHCVVEDGQLLRDIRTRNLL
jgi:hypothetical protein